MHPFPHSMTVLRAMITDPPPLVPDTALTSARAAYDQLLRVPPSWANAIEDAIIAYGRILWPYRKAFDVLLQKELSPSKRGAGSPEGLAAACSAALVERARVERAVRAAVASDPAAYQRLVQQFQELQHEIEQHIYALRRLAERAADHVDVFSEIMESVRTFERGLAYLAKEPNPKEVCAAIEGHRDRYERARELQMTESRPRIFR